MDAVTDVAVRMMTSEMAASALTAKTLRFGDPGLRLARPEARGAHPGLTMCRHVVAGLSGWEIGW